MKARTNRLGLLLALLLAAPVAINHSYAQDGPPPGPPPGAPGMEGDMPPPPGGPGGEVEREGKKPKRERGQGGGAGAGREGQMDKMLQKVLTPEEYEKFLKARREATEDPALKAKREAVEKANRELAEALEAKMLESDPAMKDIMAKVKEAREKAGKNRRNGGRPGGPGDGPADPAPGAGDGADAGRPKRHELSQEERELRGNLRQAMNNANPQTAAVLDDMQTP